MKFILKKVVNVNLIFIKLEENVENAKVIHIITKNIRYVNVWKDFNGIIGNKVVSIHVPKIKYL